MTYNLKDNSYTAWLIEANSMCLALTANGVHWVPFTDHSVFTLASATEEEAIKLLDIIIKSGVKAIPQDTFIADHAWYQGTI